MKKTDLVKYFDLEDQDEDGVSFWYPKEGVLATLLIEDELISEEQVTQIVVDVFDGDMLSVSTVQHPVDDTGCTGWSDIKVWELIK